jgi:hypothetical protein
MGWKKLINQDTFDFDNIANKPTSLADINTTEGSVLGSRSSAKTAGAGTLVTRSAQGEISADKLVAQKIDLEAGSGNTEFKLTRKDGYRGAYALINDLGATKAQLVLDSSDKAFLTAANRLYLQVRSYNYIDLYNNKISLLKDTSVDGNLGISGSIRAKNDVLVGGEVQVSKVKNSFNSLILEGYKGLLLYESGSAYLGLNPQTTKINFYKPLDTTQSLTTSSYVDAATFKVNGRAGQTETLNFITQLQFTTQGDLQFKYQSFDMSEGILTAVGTEQGWYDVPTEIP